MKRLLLMFLSFYVFSCGNLKDQSFKEILKNAQNDIKKDSVKHFTGGLPFIRPIISIAIKDTMSFTSLKRIDNLECILKKSENKQNQVEAVYNKYGLYKHNLGCMIDKQTAILSRKYKKITTSYLKKRNGKDWKNKFENELNIINTK